MLKPARPRSASTSRAATRTRSRARGPRRIGGRAAGWMTSSCFPVSAGTGGGPRAHRHRIVNPQRYWSESILEVEFASRIGALSRPTASRGELTDAYRYASVTHERYEIGSIRAEDLQRLASQGSRPSGAPIASSLPTSHPPGPNAGHGARPEDARAARAVRAPPPATARLWLPGAGDREARSFAQAAQGAGLAQDVHADPVRVLHRPRFAGGPLWGISDEELLALPRYRSSGLFSALEVTVLDYAVGMTRTPVEVPDALFASLRSQLDDQQLVELTHVIAMENMRGGSTSPSGDRGRGVQRGDGMRDPGDPRGCRRRWLVSSVVLRRRLAHERRRLRRQVCDPAQSGVSRFRFGGNGTMRAHQRPARAPRHRRSLRTENEVNPPGWVLPLHLLGAVIWLASSIVLGGAGVYLHLRASRTGNLAPRFARALPHVARGLIAPAAVVLFGSGSGSCWAARSGRSPSPGWFLAWCYSSWPWSVPFT